MPDIIGVRFKSCGKVYDFEVNDLELKKGDAVVVESELGLSIGNVVVERRVVAESKKELKKALRRATEDDFKQRSENEAVEAEARSYCIERINARGLPMKLVCTEATLDKKRIIFYFSADTRIDFRELVKDLAAKFKTRIEMRQIGVRDEAKLLGGIGICGREVCCKTFLTSFEPISIKMAKSQELVLNASKLSGVCGRLMCCLGYEYGENVYDTRRDNEVCVIEQEEKVEAEASEDIPLIVKETIDEFVEEEPATPETAAGDAVIETAETPKPEGQQATTDDQSAERKFHRRRRRPKRRHHR